MTVGSATWQLREWWLVKGGNAPEEYEDAFESVPSRGRFAVADGATETSFSGQWAALLVAALAQAPPDPEAEDDALAAWLAPLQQAWHASVPWERLSWYSMEKAQAGAFATLLGLEFFPRPEGGAYWRATAVGDTLLFQVRGEELLCAWPVAAAKDLGSRPVLLSSLSGRNPLALANWVWAMGEALPGDRFLLATDALAHWILSAVEAGQPLWDTLQEIEDAAAFNALILHEREAKRLRNDDVTLVVFEVPMLWSLAPEEPTETELASSAEIDALVPLPEPGLPVPYPIGGGSRMERPDAPAPAPGAAPGDSEPTSPDSV